MKIKRLISFLLCCLMLLLCGCNGKTEEYSAVELCNMIARDLLSGSKLTVINEEQLQSYFSFSTELLVDWRVAVCDEDEKHVVAAVFTPKDKESENKIVEELNSFISSTAARLKSLNQTEYTKLSERLLYKLDSSLILVVSDDYSSAEKYLKDLGAKKYE